MLNAHCENEILTLVATSPGTKGGTVAEWLERSSLVLKVPGSKHGVSARLFKNALPNQQ